MGYPLLAGFHPQRRHDGQCAGTRTEFLTAGFFALVALSVNSTLSVSSERQSTRHLRMRLSWEVIRNPNSSGMLAAATPVILAPPFEKLLTMHGRANSRS
jgi:hypothetical protein